MFISVLDLFKIGIGPSSSHTTGPMIAAKSFVDEAVQYSNKNKLKVAAIRCTLKDSLAYTGEGHSSDKAIALGLHGYSPSGVAKMNIPKLIADVLSRDYIAIKDVKIVFSIAENIIFDTKNSLSEHPNGMVFELLSPDNEVLLTQTYFSIGGGFIKKLEDFFTMDDDVGSKSFYNFASSDKMLSESASSGLSIAQMQRVNEVKNISMQELNASLDNIWQAMQICVENGLKNTGILPGGLDTPRRAKKLHQQLTSPQVADANDWLCTYAIAVNEENAAGHMVVTAPTNGAAGVVPATLYYLVHHKKINTKQIYNFLLTAGAIGGIIKNRASISGAEVGCQGEVGSAAAMAAAGICAANGGDAMQVEKAAEIALEHHLGLTCDPVNGLVQIPCIERNGFGAISAYLAASIAIKEGGEHLVSLDKCIETMRATGADMSSKYKETSLGGLAVSMIEC